MGLTRGLDPVFAAEIARDVWHPVIFVYVGLSAGPLRLHSRLGAITFGGAEWVGAGRFGTVAAPGEGAGLAASRVTLGLVGMPPEVLTFSGGVERNRAGEIWIGATQSATDAALVGAPHLAMSGYIDAMRYTIRQSGGAIEHGVQLDLGVGPSARSAATVVHSAEDQARRYPGDTAGRWLIDALRRVETMTWPES